MALIRGGGEGTDADLRGGFGPECDFGTVDAIDAGIAARRAAGSVYAAAGEETHLHKAPAKLVGNVEVPKHRVLAAAKIGETGRLDRFQFLAAELVETQLHSRFRIGRRLWRVKLHTGGPGCTARLESWENDGRGVLSKMKYTLLALTFALGLSAAEYKGWISDAQCGAGNAGSNKASRDCAENCIKGGAAPVFVTEKEQSVYKVNNADLAKAHLKGKVQITGEIKGDTIHIAKIVDIKD